MRTRQKGFTLIELLVVVAILGIIAAVAIPNFNKFLSVGTDTAMEVELANVDTAVMAYSVDTNGEYPTATSTYPGDIDFDLLYYDYMRDEVSWGDYAIDADGIVYRK